MIVTNYSVSFSIIFRRIFVLSVPSLMLFDLSSAKLNNTTIYTRYRVYLTSLLPVTLKESYTEKHQQNVKYAQNRIEIKKMERLAGLFVEIYLMTILCILPFCFYATVLILPAAELKAMKKFQQYYVLKITFTNCMDECMQPQVEENIFVRLAQCKNQTTNFGLNLTIWQALILEGLLKKLTKLIKYFQKSLTLSVFTIKNNK